MEPCRSKIQKFKKMVPGPGKKKVQNVGAWNAMCVLFFLRQRKTPKTQQSSCLKNRALGTAFQATWEILRGFFYGLFPAAREDPKWSTMIRVPKNSQKKLPGYRPTDSGEGTMMHPTSQRDWKKSWLAGGGMIFLRQLASDLKGLALAQYLSVAY